MAADDKFLAKSLTCNFHRKLQNWEEMILGVYVRKFVIFGKIISIEHEILKQFISIETISTCAY